MRVNILACSTLVLLAVVVGSSPVRAALSTSLTNGDFNDNSDSNNNRVDNWGEHEIYGGPGPDGFGNFHGFAPTLPSSPSSLRLGLIRGDNDANTATAMQSIGTVDASDVGKQYTFSAGAVAWDWWLDTDVPVAYSAAITLSFRDGATPDNGNFANFNYGTLLGTAGTLVTAVTGGNGTQDGVGDPGALIPVSATFTPTAADIGKPVSVVINLGTPVTNNFGGENRYLVDNATLTVIPEPSTLALVAGVLAFGLVARRRS